IFNMLPVPPLDGSRIFLLFLPEKTYFGVMRFERYTMIIIFILLWIGVLGRPLALMQGALFRFLDSATLFVDAAMRALLTASTAVVT
ncbi:MAG: site-2 protease family protein, partial [Oscillospiraceae bacterium]|nr:site-2 protease family protein [Oscillospiraceae bacterium]